jgi:Leucine rich repeat
VVEVEIPFTEHGGKTRAIRVNDNTTTIDMTGKGIAAVNLTSVRACGRLTRLLLNDNELTVVDLSPLTACPQLTVLALKKNRLQGLDLCPLKDLTRLEALDLKENMLTRLDLSPIKKHMSLQKVFLAGNPLTELDVSALLTCRSLKEVDIGRHVRLKADMTLAGSSVAVMQQYKKQITWVDARTLETQAATVTAAQSHIKALSQDIQDSMRKRVLGVLKSQTRICMEKLAPYSGLPVDETRELVFEFVGSGAVTGRFDPDTDEFISLDAVQAASLMRSEGPVIQKCRYCGKPFPKTIMPGESYTCESCGQVNQA